MQLRFILTLVLASLLTLTAGAVGWVGYSSSRLNIKQVTSHEFAMGNEAAATQIAEFLNNPTNRLLTELSLRARRGMLNLEDEQGLGFDLAERLRVNKDLAWISYSDAKTGRFVGVWRNKDSQVLINHSMPDQIPQEAIVTPEGKLIPSRDANQAKYDPRTYSWYTDAMASPGTAWSKPYDFVDGDLGITASQSWTPNGATAPEGVFTVDYYLRDLEHLLSNLDVLTQGFLCVFDLKGDTIFSAESPQKGKLTEVLSTWIKQHPNFKNVAPQDNDHLIPLQVDGEIYLSALYRVDKPPGLQFIVVSTARKSDVFIKVERAKQRMVLATAAALLLAAAIGWIMAYRISEPLRLLGDDLTRVGRFNLESRTGPRSAIREVNQLRHAADRMRSGLRSFMKYVPSDLVRQLLSTGQEAMLGVETRRLTLFFSDIEGFTTYSEKVTRPVLVKELSGYFQIMRRTLTGRSGTLDKFIGDGVLAFFNAPVDVPEHEKLACLAALEALQELRESQARDGSSPFHTRVGLHGGEVLVGNIGTPEQFAYTVLGDAVNVASRLEGLNKIYGTQIIASGEVRDRAGDGFEWRHLDRVTVAGRQGVLEIYELMGVRGKVEASLLQARDQYEAALRHYFDRTFDDAVTGFVELAHGDSMDKAARLMAERCQQMAATKMPVNWDGVFVFGVK